MKKFSIFFYVINILAAVTMLISFVIPYTTATSEWEEELNNSGKYYVYYDKSNYILTDRVYEFSFADYLEINGKYHNILSKMNSDLDKPSKRDKSPLDYYQPLFFAILIVSLLVLIFTSLRKNIISIILSVLVIILLVIVNTLTVSSLLYDYSLLNDNYEPYIGMYTYFVSAGLIIVGSFVQIFTKKKLPKKVPVAPTNVSMVQNNIPASQPNLPNNANVSQPQVTPVKQQNKYCSYCGKEIPSDSLFCLHCGQKLTLK